MSRGRINAGIAAFLWVLCAVIVALPTELMKFDWFSASEKLLSELHALFIVALIFLDVWIGAIFLGDTRIILALRQNLLKLSLAIALPAIFVGAFARANPAVFWNHISYVGIFVVVMLFLLRFWTYHRSVGVSPITMPTLDE